MSDPAQNVIARGRYPAAAGKRVNLYIGSGRMGACFGSSGLMDATSGPNAVRTGETVLMHAAHWHRGVFGIDQQVPVARIHWAEEPDTMPDRWQQSLDTETGLLRTTFRRGESRVDIRVSCHPCHGDFMCLGFDGKSLPDVFISPVRVWTTCYGEGIRAPSDPKWTRGGRWCARVRLGSADSALLVGVEGSATARALGGTLRISFHGGPARLLVGVSIWSARKALGMQVPGGDFFRSAAAAWKRRAMVVPAVEEEAHMATLARRSVYHLLCSYSEDAWCPPPPMGWTGNAWGHHFPQDLSYIHPVFLRIGRHDIARRIVEFYASRIGQMEEATARIYGLPGTMWAWEFPIGPDTRILPDNRAPNFFHYEIHNAAYPARMAFETSKATGDKEWARAVALPVALGSAAFYASALKRGRDGRWGIHLRPSMGQDEFGGNDAPDYLCALFAATYTLRASLSLCSGLGIRHPHADHWRRILHEGMAFPRLLDRDTGVYASSRVRGWRLHNQKHPVQLAPLFSLPQPVDAATRKAYLLRHQLCANDRPALRHPGTGGSFYDGWTLFAYALACAKAGDAQAARETLAEVAIAQLTDHENIQIYESSGFWKPYYTTSMGLFLQALLPRTSGRASRVGPSA